MTSNIFLQKKNYGQTNIYKTCGPKLLNFYYFLETTDAIEHIEYNTQLSTFPYHRKVLE